MNEKNEHAADANAPQADHSQGDHHVGYGRPPVSTRFQKGRSGNPKGRPRRRSDLSELLVEHLGERIGVTSGNGKKKLSKAEVLLTGLVNRTLGGDRKAFRSFAKVAAKTGHLKPLPVPEDDSIPYGVVELSYEEQQEVRRNPHKLFEIAKRAKARAASRQLNRPSRVTP